MSCAPCGQHTIAAPTPDGVHEPARDLRIPYHGPADAKSPSMCEEIMLALVRQVAGVRLVWSTQWLTHGRAVQELAAGRLDADCGYYRTPEREAQLLYSRQAAIRLETVLAVRVDDPATVESFDDLRAALADGHDMVLVNAGSAFLDRLHQAGISDRNIDAWASHSDTNLRKLMRGRGRFFIFRNPGLTEIIQSNGWDGRVRVLPHPLAMDEQFLVFSRHLDPALRERLEAALAGLAADGTLAQIAQRHGGRPPGL
nr:transporter substrate-binding domain-containing protein [Nitrospirillum iridis]